MAVGILKVLNAIPVVFKTEQHKKTAGLTEGQVDKSIFHSRIQWISGHVEQTRRRNVRNIHKHFSATA